MKLFSLKIKLGNEAMQTGEDVADALKRVAERLSNGEEYGYIMDLNGNKVGKFSL